jgi:hypothetical protein
MALKALAYFLTGSVGLLADALESLVNLVAALMALAMLRILPITTWPFCSKLILQTGAEVKNLAASCEASGPPN